MKAILNTPVNSYSVGSIFKVLYFTTWETLVEKDGQKLWIKNEHINLSL